MSKSARQPSGVYGPTGYGTVRPHHTRCECCSMDRTGIHSRSMRGHPRPDGIPLVSESPPRGSLVPLTPACSDCIMMFCPASSTCARKPLRFPRLTVPFSVYRKTRTPRARCYQAVLVPHQHLDQFLIESLHCAWLLHFFRFQKGSIPLRVAK
jgi:hypothetical protein